MMKLLQFFYSRVFIEIIKFFVGAIVISLLIQVSPLEPETKDSFIKFFVYFVFPVIAYFNRKVYLPASLEWILLTPTKKVNIVLSHGVLNVSKIIFIVVLVNIFFLIYHQDFKLIPIMSLWNEISEAETSMYSRSSTSSWIYSLVFIGLCLFFVVGIFPSYVHTMQEKLSHRTSKDFKENLKKIIPYLLVVPFLLFIFTEDQIVDAYLPDVIKVSAALAAIFIGAVSSTLHTIRFYVSKKALSLIAIVSFISMSSFLSIHSLNDIRSNDLRISDKLKSLEYLGGYAPESEALIEKELMGAGPSLTELHKFQLKSFFSSTDRVEMFNRVATHWKILCKKQKDYTCRLTAYLNSFDRPTSVDFVRQSCPNDLGSCQMVYDYMMVPKEERKIAREALEKGCQDNKNEFLRSTCGAYQNDLEKKKKRLSKNPTTPDSQNTSLLHKTFSPPAPRPSPGGRK
jgi:hypothetical protein